MSVCKRYDSKVSGQPTQQRAGFESSFARTLSNLFVPSTVIASDIVNLPLPYNLFFGFIMKKVLVTYQVKDPDWWVLNNKLQQATAHLGFRFELFRKKYSNVVGYVVEIPNEDDLTELLLNTTDISTRLNEHGVILETIEILEAVTNGGTDQTQ
jgi:hypothetical protein